MNTTDPESTATANKPKRENENVERLMAGAVT
jgi:hypothetical protein